MRTYLSPEVSLFLTYRAQDPTCFGREAFARRQPHARSAVYEYYRCLDREGVVDFPSFTISALGLTHVHLFLREPGEEWLRFPYAIEGTWVRETWQTRVLYLHCCVPTRDLARLEGLVRGYAAEVTWLVSEDGWQRARFTPLPDPRAPPPVAMPEADLLRRTPLIVPVIMESWNQPAGHGQLWHRIHTHLGREARAYVPDHRCLPINGKRDVFRAFHALQHARLFRQCVIRYPLTDARDLEVILLVTGIPSALTRLVARLTPSATLIETYSGPGHCLVRLTGDDHTILQSLLAPLPEGVTVRTTYLTTDRGMAPVRFAYELLFDPTTGTWQYPEAEIRAALATEEPP